MSSYGEDIIRETFEKFGDAIGVQMQIPDAMIANLGAVLQAQIDLLAELQSTGRLIPAGGMALTAEQVEDVRTVLEYAGGMPHESRIRLRRAALRLVDAVGYPNAYLVQELREALAEVDGEFPATEPAKEVKPIRYRTMTPKFATEHFGFPDVTGLFERTHTASDGGTWGWCGGDWELLVYPSAPADLDEEDEEGEETAAEYFERTRRFQSTTPPAPAVPAEEETKAERDSEGIIRINGGRIVALSCDTREMVQRWFDIAKPGSKWQRDYAAALDLFDREAASSPVVPAPTDTGPWQDISEAPKHLTLIDRVGDKWTYDGDNWITPETAILPVLYINRKYAPFVAAKEG